MSVITLYRIPAPYSAGDTMIEVYGGDGEGWCEWRILGVDGRIQQDTGTEGTGSIRGRQYGSAEIALRDALMAASDQTDPYQLKTYFGLQVVRDRFVRLDDIRTLPFFEFWEASSFGSTMLKDPDGTTLVYLHDWESFARQFFKTGKHRYSK